MRKHRPGRGLPALLAAVLVATAIGASACGDDDSSSASSDGGKQKVTLQLGWIAKEEYAFIYAGQKQGIFEKHGIDLQILNGKGSLTAIQTVANGGAMFGYTGGPPFFQAVGEGLPLKMVAVMLQTNPTVILSWPDAPVREIQDIEDKSLILTPGDGFTAQWPYIAKANGVPADSVEELSIGVSARAQSFAAHKADAIPYFVTTSIEALEDQAKTKFVQLPASAMKGAQILSNGLFTTDDLIDEDPALVRRMTAAFTESWDFAEKNPGEAAQAVQPLLPGTEVDQITEVVKATNELSHTQASEGQPTGWSAPVDWTESIEIMKGSGLVKETFEPDHYYTNKFIPGA